MTRMNAVHSIANSFRVHVLLGLLFQRLDMQFERARHGVGQRAYLLWAKAYRTTATETAQLIGDFFDTVGLRERAEDAQIQRDQSTQCLRQGGDVTAGLADVDKHFQWPMLVAIDRDIDLPLRRVYLAGISPHDRRSRLNPLLDRSHRRHYGGLLFLLLWLLLLDMRKHAHARAVAHIGDALAAQFVCQPVEGLHIFHRMAVGRVDRLADARVRILLDGCLHAHVFFGRQVIGGDEVFGRWLVGVFIAPFL